MALVRPLVQHQSRRVPSEQDITVETEVRRLWQWQVLDLIYQTVAKRFDGDVRLTDSIALSIVVKRERC